MPGQDKSSKTEQPTAKRLRDTRQKGQVARSIELSSILVFVCTLIFFKFYFPVLLLNIQNFIKHIFAHSDHTLVSKDYVDSFIKLSITTYLDALLPFFVFSLILSLFVNYAQGGFLFSTQPIHMKLSKLNPISGFSRLLLSKRALVELLKNILKISIVGYVGYKTIQGFFPEISIAYQIYFW